MPPLIAQVDEGRLILTDGNHRYSALARTGKMEYAVLLWCNKEKETETERLIEQNGWK